MRNDEDTVYTLIHSPLVGGLTWTLVAQELSARGYPVAVPHLADQATSPFICPRVKGSCWSPTAGPVPCCPRSVKP